MGNDACRLKNSSIYIAGPMRGYPRFNADAFNEMEATLGNSWETIYNPIRLDTDAGIDIEDTSQDIDIKACLKRDIEVIFKSDALMMLDGWENSKGARAEHALAVCLGLKIFYES